MASERVWIVETGEYSGRKIERVFSNQAQANAFADTFSRKYYGSGAQVWEWPVDDDFSGDTIYWNVNYWPPNHPTVEREDALPEYSGLNCVEMRRDGGQYGYSVWVRAQREDDAIKAAAELFARARADMAGIT